MSVHVMVDIETMGSNADAPIVSIGAVKFDPMKRREQIDAIYLDVDLESAVRYGGKMDAGTVMWWMHPDREAARAYITASSSDRTRHDLPTALEGFAIWFGEESLPTWGNGATFDNVILRRAYDRLGLKCPWFYGHDRCYRTFKALAPAIELERVGDYHNALHDAISQTHHFQAIREHLGLSL